MSNDPSALPPYARSMSSDRDRFSLRPGDASA